MLIIPYTVVRFITYIDIIRDRIMGLYICRCEGGICGYHTASAVHAPAPAGTTIDGSLADIRAKQSADPLVRLVDAARRVAALSGHTVVVTRTGLRSWRRCQNARDCR
jgi:hypothetical protein